MDYWKKLYNPLNFNLYKKVAKLEKKAKYQKRPTHFFPVKYTHVLHNIIYSAVPIVIILIL